MGALEKWDAEYEGAKPPESEHDEVPDGRYSAYIEGLDLAQSKAGNPMLKFSLRIAAGQHANRMVFKNSAITSGSIEFVKKELLAIGFAGKLSELETVEGRMKLVNILVEIMVKSKGEDAQGRVNRNVYINRRIVETPGHATHSDPPPF